MRAGVALLQPGAHRVEPPAVRDAVVRAPPPVVQGPVGDRDQGRVALAGEDADPFGVGEEDVGVDVGRVEVEAEPALVAEQDRRRGGHTRIEDAPEPPHQRVQRRGGPRRCGVGPHEVDEPRGGERLVAVDQQGRQDGLHPAAAQRVRHPVAFDRERPEITDDSAPRHRNQERTSHGRV